MEETITNIYSSDRVEKYIFGLILILVSNLCFYTANSIEIHIVLSCIGMIIIWFLYLDDCEFQIHIEEYVVWITLIFAMFTIYGTFFLQKGVYNWDKMLFTYAQSITLYSCFKVIVRMEKWWKYLFIAFSISLIITFIYLVIKEGNLILLDTSRIGFSLSGDVNVVSDCMGIMLILIFYYYLQERKKLALLLTIIVLIFMLLTGSKRVVFAFGIMIIMAYPYASKSINILIIVGIMIFVGKYAVFESRYFYNLIGYRFVDMYFQLIRMGSNSHYTSTNARMGMILEGLKLFLNNPIFGGGMGYYSSRSEIWSYYNYSHCNYVEMLCTFGIVGTVIYYVPFIRNIILLVKKMREIEGAGVVIGMLAHMLIIDFVSVSFLEICIYYLTITLSFAVIQVDRDRTCFL